MNDIKYIKSAKLRASFHGETWFTCPYCDKAFEIFDTKFERGFKKTAERNIFIHTNCGNKIRID